MIVSACMYIASFAGTWGPMAWVVIGETFPLRTRAKQASLATASNWLGNCKFIRDIKGPGQKLVSLVMVGFLFSSRHQRHLVRFRLRLRRHQPLRRRRHLDVPLRISHAQLGARRPHVQPGGAHRLEQLQVDTPRLHHPTAARRRLLQGD